MKSKGNNLKIEILHQHFLTIVESLLWDDDGKIVKNLK